MKEKSAISIGLLGKWTGVNIETIRYYEKIGLLPAPQRTAAGYRQYGEDHVRRLRFIRGGRDLGFAIEDIRALLWLADHPEQSCEDADRRVVRHLEEVERKIADLTRLRRELLRMANCTGQVAAECRIIDALTVG
ncbi:MAG: helix-turn-helix domain-containing protein [Magnetospirillum sp. WYHS-4]